MELTPVGSTQTFRPEAETTVQAEPELHRQVEPGRIEKSGNEEANRSEELMVGEKETEEMPELRSLKEAGGIRSKIPVWYLATTR